MNNDQQLTSTAPAAVGLADNHLPELLQATVADYIDQLNDTPALCQTPKQQTRLISLIADGKSYLK